MDLSEALPALEKSLPEVPQDLQAVQEHDDRVRQNAEALLHALDQTRQEAARAFDEVGQAVSGLREEAQRQHESLEADLHEVEVDLAALDELTVTQHELEAGLQAVDAAMGHLAGHLHEESDALAAAEQRMAVALDSLEQSLHSGQQQLTSLSDALLGVADQVKSAAEATRSVITTQVQAMCATADQVQARLASLMEEALEGHLPELVTELKGQLDVAGETLREELDGVTAQWRQRLQDEVKTVVNVSRQYASTALQCLAGEAEGAAPKWEGERNDLEAPLEPVARDAAALEQGVSSVKAAATQVGLAWA